MDQRQREPSYRAGNNNHTSNCKSRQSLEPEGKDPVAARKVQKADRERLRRDRLNEQFRDLGNTVDPDRSKIDKATILSDTIQLLKDSTAEVNRLKSECISLTEESRELTQEKNELREEKASLRADIENLSAQYQQRLRAMFPWGPVDPSVVMAPPPYTFPLPLTVPPGAIPVHPTLQPFPFFGSQNPGALPPNHRSPYVPYTAPVNPQADQQQQQQQQSYASTSSEPSIKQDSTSKTSSRNLESTDESNDVATDLELKTPGSAVQQESSSKVKQSQREEKGVPEGQSSSWLSSSQGPKESSSNSVGHI